MSRAWIWVAPDPDSFVSGGNRYNRQLAGALQQAGDTLTWMRPDQAARYADGAGETIRIWDSLYLDALRERTGQGKAGDYLLAHYLPADVLPEQVRWMRTLDGVIVPGGAMADILEHLGLPRRRILVLEPGLEAVPLAEGPPLNGPLRLLTVANLLPEKGLLPFLEAMRQRLPGAPHPPEWALIGDERIDPGHAQRILVWLEDPVFQGHWRCLGRRAPSRIWADYPHFDAFLSPSPSESFGMAVREALQGGLPVLGLRGGHLPALVHSEAQGRLFDRAEELADFICAMDPTAFRARWPRPLPPALRPGGPDWSSQAARLQAWVHP